MTIHPPGLRLALASALIIGAAVVARSQEYPSTPIRLLVPYAPGGIVDYVGRALGRNLSQAIGQPVLADGAGHSSVHIAAAAVARAAPDGTTLLLADAAIVIEPILREDFAHGIAGDLQIVSIVSSSPQVLVTALSLPVTNLAQLIAYGKSNPAKLRFASAGFGTPSHLAGEMFKLRSGVDAAHVAYRGSGAPFTDLMAGKVHIAFSSLASALPFTTDKRVRAIATTGAKRTSVYPDLPTIKEAGLAEFEVDLWLAVFAPAGMPAAARARLHGGLQKALATPDMQASLAMVGIEPRGTGAAEGADVVRAEAGKWRQVIMDAKIRDR